MIAYLLAFSWICSAAIHGLLGAQDPTNALPRPDRAQSGPASGSVSQTTKSDRDPGERALEIVSYTATLVPNFPRIESQAIAYSALGEAMWSVDQKRAKAFYESAFMALLKDDGHVPPRDRKESRSREEIERWRERTRSQLLSRISQLDLDLARELARRAGAKGVNNNSDADKKTPEEDGDLAFQRAYELLESDPARAAALARRTLAGGISPWLAEFLPALRQRAPGLADELFDAALTVATARSNPPDPTDLNLLGVYLLQSDRGTNPVLARRFLTLMAYALQAQSDSNAPLARRLSLSEQLFLLKLYLPLLERYASELVPSAQTLVNNLYARLPPEQRAPVQPGSGTASSSVAQGQQGTMISSGSLGEAQGLLAPETKDGEGRSDPGLIMKIRDEKTRQTLLDAYFYNLARKDLEQDRLDEASSGAERIQDNLKKADIYSELARKFADRGVRDRAVILLDKAHQRLASLDDLQERANQILILSRNAFDIDPDRSFRFAEAGISVLNRLRAAPSPDASPAEELSRREAVRLYLDAALIPLGRSDFDRAIYVAMQLEDPEQRVLAEIAACRPVLQAAALKAKHAGEKTPTPSQP